MISFNLHNNLRGGYDCSSHSKGEETEATERRADAPLKVSNPHPWNWICKIYCCRFCLLFADVIVLRIVRSSYPPGLYNSCYYLDGPVVTIRVLTRMKQEGPSQRGDGMREEK